MDQVLKLRMDIGDVSTHEDYGFPPVLDADQTARLLHLASGREALKLAREQRIPSVKLAKKVLFVRDQLIETLIQQSRPALTDAELQKGPS